MLSTHHHVCRHRSDTGYQYHWKMQQKSFRLNFHLTSMDDLEFDVLTEIGNIGAGNATTALSQLINTRIDMRVPQVRLLSFAELAEIIGVVHDRLLNLPFLLLSYLPSQSP
mgnify:CR=1 FL=1